MGVLAIFDEQGRWAETHVCDGQIATRLAAVGLNWGASDSTPARGVDAQDVRLVYLPVAGGGHFGVLCESGEWVGPAAGPQAPAGLPSLEEFIEHMLVLTGHEGEDEEG